MENWKEKYDNLLMDFEGLLKVLIQTIELLKKDL